MEGYIMENTCQTCLHFIQHYIKREKSFITVYCGHCVYPLLKSRKGDTPACKHYKQGQSETVSSTDA